MAGLPQTVINQLAAVKPYQGAYNKYGMGPQHRFFSDWQFPEPRAEKETPKAENNDPLSGVADIISLLTAAGLADKLIFDGSGFKTLKEVAKSGWGAVKQALGMGDLSNTPIDAFQLTDAAARAGGSIPAVGGSPSVLPGSSDPSLLGGSTPLGPPGTTDLVGGIGADILAGPGIDAAIAAPEWLAGLEATTGIPELGLAAQTVGEGAGAAAAASPLAWAGPAALGAYGLYRAIQGGTKRPYMAAGFEIDPAGKPGAVTGNAGYGGDKWLDQLKALAGDVSGRLSSRAAAEGKTLHGTSSTPMASNPDYPTMPGMVDFGMGRNKQGPDPSQSYARVITPTWGERGWEDRISGVYEGQPDPEKMVEALYRSLTGGGA